MKLLLLLLTVFLSSAVHAQLPGFSLLVSKTDETCAGNGSLTIVTTNVAAGATLLFKVYKLPDVATPVSITTQTLVSSLTSGSYKVMAVQAVGNLTNSQEQTVTINNAIVPFNFVLSSQNLNCATGANIVVTAESGVASAYEIISGPETRPLQASNVFQGLPSGSYSIRAFDECGVAKVKTYTLNITNTSLTISDAYYGGAVAACDSIRINNRITPSEGAISYPLQLQYRILPMNIAGEETIINKVVAAGSPDSLVVSAVLPRYSAGSYSYELQVIDACNTTYGKIDNSVSSDIEAALTKGKLLCAQRYLKVSASKYMAPYTIEFLSAPQGFSANAFNTSANGPFTEDTVHYGGEGNAVPFGTYVVKIIDACGRTAQDSIDIQLEPLVPDKKGANNGCFSLFGSIRISVPDQQLITAVIISAPPAYNQALPQDVSSFITSGGTLMLINMPLGTYEVKVTDNCGFEYTVTVIVPPFEEKNFEIKTLPTCNQFFGSLKVYSNNGPLTSVQIIAAPSAYGQILPYDVTANITDDGELYLHNLPEGTYTVKATDHCGIVKQLSTLVLGYTPPVNAFVYTPGCGTFSVKVIDGSNGIEGVTYFLQKYFPATNTWGHPQTGYPYIEGDMPGTGTGYKLYNNVLRSNIAITGKFRILKKFETFWQSSNNNLCISILGEFEFTDALAINNAYTMSCTGNPNDVYIDAVGQVVSYKIEKKNGAPFIVNNGASNIFTNLEPATYLFSIEDVCGNKLVKEFNLRELPSIADATQPADMHICLESGSAANPVFHLAGQNAMVLGQLPAAMYTITYHLTQQDADSGTNPLPEFYTSIANGQKIYVRLVNNHITICHGTTSFALFSSNLPIPQIATTGAICDGQGVALTANGGYDSYLWSTGETTRTIFVSQPGEYTVVVEKDFGTQVCTSAANVEIVPSSAPEIVKIDTHDWTSDENTVTVTAQGSGVYQYSVDGINFQDSNVFTNLACGAYQVYVKDAYGCGMDVQEVVLMNYPNFFTPNGDGHHDTWRIEYAVLEPHLQVTIFDRYGKVITSFGSSGEGWDGTYNGTQLPSTDYWFVVTREDGRELKGHFAMLR